MRLWTYQHPSVSAALARGEVVRGDWAHVERLWRASYERLIRELVARGLQEDEVPPVWAWHSWAHWAEEPNDEAAKLLLSEYELQQGVERLVLDVPDDRVLLSRYTIWNELLEPPVHDDHEALWGELFEVRPPDPGAPLDQAVQACLPRLEPGWVVSASPLSTKV